MIEYHIIASCHMLDAHNAGTEWACACESCAETRKNSALVEAFWVEIRKKPADPNAKRTPVVAKVEL